MKSITSFVFFAVLSLPLTAKEIAITFDDAPLNGTQVMSGEERTKRIIEHLNKASAKAMFFVTTNNIRSAQDKARLHRYTKAGHSLAHHSHSHLSAEKSTVQSYLKDFDKATQILQSFNNVAMFHRFPYLRYGKTSDKREQLHSALQERNYRIGYITIDNYDWYINSKLVEATSQGAAIDFEQLKQLYLDTLLDCINFYENIAQETLGRSPKHVLLLHENDLAEMFLGDLLEHLQRQGWSFISAQNAFTDPIANLYNPTKMSFNNQGRIAAIAQLNGASKKHLIHPSEDTKYLDKKLVEYAVFSAK